MALQLQGRADLRHDILKAVNKPVSERTRPWRTGPRAQVDVSNSPSSGANSKISLPDGVKRMLPTSVAVPNHSRHLREGRRRHHVLKSHAGDRLLEIAEWVSRKVKDPLVEIDPVTIKKKIKAEEQSVMEEAAIRSANRNGRTKSSEVLTDEDNYSTTSSPAIFGLPISGFPGGNNAALAAGVALVLVTVGAAYLALRGNSKQKYTKSGTSPHSSAPPAGLAGADFAGTSRKIIPSVGDGESSPPQDLHEQFRYSSNGDSSDKAVSRRASVVLTSFQTRPDTFRPIPSFSNNLEQSDLPLPPSLWPLASGHAGADAIPRDQDMSHPVSTGASHSHTSSSGELKLDEDLLPAGNAEEKPRLFGEAIGSSTSAALEPALVKYIPEDQITFPTEELTLGTPGGDVPNAAETTMFEYIPEDQITIPNEKFISGTPDGNVTAVAETGMLEYIPEDQISSLNEELRLITPSTEATEDARQVPDLGTQSFGVSSEVVVASDSESAPAHSTKELIVGKPIMEMITSSGDLNLAVQTNTQRIMEELSVAAESNGPSADNKADVDRRNSRVEALQAVVPAMAVGAGALSAITGVDGGLEMVGLAATISFLTQEILPASSRQQLFDQIGKIRDHKSFWEFLKARDIIGDIPEQ